MGHLLVPITVEAFTANRYNEPEKWISDVLPDYTALSDTILGDNLQKAPFSIQEPLEQGVHLHFILPDALTHGIEQDGVMQYPDIPDRWLVVRIQKQYAFSMQEQGTSRFSDAHSAQAPAFDMTAWMVESDYIGMEETEVPIPALQDIENPCRYLGRCSRLDETPEKGSYLGGLTAFGPGDPAFAAYYPSCRGVLGFHDPLEDVPYGTLTYFAAGWYGSGKDPFASLDPETWKEKLEEFAWEVDGMPKADDAGNLCSPVLCHGMVCGIDWKGPDAEYDDGRTKGHIDVTVGDTSAEALSALLASKLPDGGSQDMELLFNALQYGCLDLADEIDGRQKIQDRVHAARFGADRDETAWELAAEQAAEPLPDEIRLLHQALSECQEEKNRWFRNLESLKQRLYDVWHTYFLLYEDPYFAPAGDAPKKEEIYGLFQSLCRQIDEEQKQGEELVRKRDAARHALQSALKGTNGLYRVEKAPAQSYQQCCPPTLLFSGEGLRRGFVYGEDGRFNKENKLVCRLSDSIVESLEIPVGGTDGAAGSTAVIGRQELWAYCTGMALPEFVQGLVCETLLFDPSLADLLAYISYQALGLPYEEKDLKKLSDEIKKRQAMQSGFSGTCPSKVSVNFYEPSMNTLFLEWKVLFYPTRTEGHTDDSMNAWTFGDTDYDYNGAPVGKPAAYMGRTVVTPHSQRIFQAALRKEAEQCQDEQLRKKLEQSAELLQDLCLLSQNLDGFTQNLTGRTPAPQFPYLITSEELADDRAAKEMTLAAAGYLKDFPAVPPLDGGRFFPIRAGFLKIQEIQLVGSFGQRQVITAAFDTISSTSDMKPPSISIGAHALLRPRISQGGRIQAKWLCADDKSASPVCGFIIPDWLNRGLMIYDAAGIRLGNAQLVWRDGRSFCRWQPMALAEEKTACSAPVFENKYLSGYVQSLLGTGAGEFASLLRYMERRQNETVPESMSHSAEESLFCGRPAALVRAEISLCLRGLAEYSKSLAGFGTFDSGQFEHAAFAAAVGDASRSHEGCMGYFTGTDIEQMYETMYPCGHALRLAHDGVPVQMCLLVEPACAVTIHTGICPALGIRLPEESYQEAYRHLDKSFAVYPLLGTSAGVRLPVSEMQCRQWDLACPQPEGEYLRMGLLPDLADFTGEGTVIIEGQLVEKQGNADAQHPLVKQESSKEQGGKNGNTKDFDLRSSPKRGLYQ